MTGLHAATLARTGRAASATPDVREWDANTTYASLNDTMKSLDRAAFCCIIALAVLASTAAGLSDAQGNKVAMYYFWQVDCAHCEDLKPFMADLEEKYPLLDLKRLEISKIRENGELFDELAKAYGRKAKVTPTVFVGEYMIEGYNGWITEGRIESALLNCTGKACISPMEKLARYNAGTSSTTTITTRSSSTTTTTTTSSSTTTSPDATTTFTSPTSATTTTSYSTTTTLEPVEDKKDNTLLNAVFAVLLALCFVLSVIRRKNGMI